MRPTLQKGWGTRKIEQQIPRAKAAPGNSFAASQNTRERAEPLYDAVQSRSRVNCVSF
jgi:hypothetical protein